MTTSTLNDTNRYLTITYYDNYDFKNLWLDEYDYLDVDLSASVNNISYTQREYEFRFVKGQVTCSKVKVLDGGVAGGFSWLQTVNYYDEKYRLIQTVSDNYKGGQDRTTNLYDFTGNLLTSEMRHSTNEISWTDLANVKIVGNHILKTTSGSGWIAGAATVETLAAGADGWIECVITETNQIRAFGLTSSNENLNFNTIGYAFWHDAASARIYENGNLKYTLPSPVVPGDIIRIERKNSSVQFYRTEL